MGESLLSSADGIIDALHGGEALGGLISIAILALVSTAAVWWIYFWPPHEHAITSFSRSLQYGYTHYVVFAAAGAFSAGVGVEIDRLLGASQMSEVAASFTVTVPIAIFLLGIWFVAIRCHADRIVNAAVLIGAALVLLDPILPIPVALTAVVLAAIVAVLVARQPRAEAAG